MKNSTWRSSFKLIQTIVKYLFFDGDSFSFILFVVWLQRVERLNFSPPHTFRVEFSLMGWEVASLKCSSSSTPHFHKFHLLIACFVPSFSFSPFFHSNSIFSSLIFRLLACASLSLALIETGTGRRTRSKEERFIFGFMEWLVCWVCSVILLIRRFFTWMRCSKP